MKRFFLILSIVLVAVVCFENRAALLYLFVHDGMTKSNVVRLLGSPPGDATNSIVVQGQLGTGPAHQIWLYHYRFLGWEFGGFRVRFEGNDTMLTHY